MKYFNQQSNRLTFRKLTRLDIPIWTTFFQNNDRLKYLGIDLSKDAVTHATDWIEKQLERYPSQGLGHLAVETKRDKTFIGVGGILPRNLENQQVYEIAYSLLPAFWKQGYGTEVAQQMRHFGFKHLKLAQLVSIIDKNNLNSINVAKKNGMEVLFETHYLGMDVEVFGVQNPII